MGNVGLPHFCYLDIYKVWIFLHNPSMSHIMLVSEQPSPAPKAAQERRGRKTLEPSRNLQANCEQGSGAWSAPSPCGFVGPRVSLEEGRLGWCSGSQPRLYLRFTSRAQYRDSGSSCSGYCRFGRLAPSFNVHTE